MEETPKEKAYYDMVEVVKQFDEEAAELLYFDAIFQPKFEFNGSLIHCFSWRGHYKGCNYWASIYWQLRSWPLPT